MEQIAAGKGRGPKPFMAAGAKASEPERHLALEPAKEPRPSGAPRPTLRAAASARKTSKAAASGHAALHRRRSCARPVARPPQGDDWVHEIKFDGYRMQLRVEDGAATLRTRKGLDWTDKFRAIAEAAARLARCHHRRRGRCARRQRRAELRGAAGGALGGAVAGPGLSSCSICSSMAAKICASLPLSERKERLKALLAKERRPPATSATSSILPGAGDAVLQSACRMHLEGIISKRAQRAVPLRPHRELAQIQMPRRP